MWKICSTAMLVTVLGLTGCKSNIEKLEEDTNIPVEAVPSLTGRSFTIPEGATGPLADILLNPIFSDGREFSIGDKRYKKLAHGVGELL